MLWGYFCPKTTSAAPATSNAPENQEIFTGYDSDQTDDTNSDDDDDGGSGSGGNDADNEGESRGSIATDSPPNNASPVIKRVHDDTDAPFPHPKVIPTQEISSFGIAERKCRNAAIEDATPRPKRLKLEMPIRTRRQRAKNELFSARIDALMRIEKLLNASQSPFEGGHNGLQARRARAIHGYLHMLVRNDRKRIDASEHTAEAQGFAARWGGRQVCAWADTWINQGKLPVSRRGRHIGIFTLLEDPKIRAELRSYVRSNKWAIDPAKLVEFTSQKMIPRAARMYGTNLMKNDIPKGLKQYLKLELFPRIHVKAMQGVSIRTARRWLHREGFRFTEHRKALYFDGHERPDVVEYRQSVFIPEMKQHRRRIVEYMVGEVGKERKKPVENYVERRLVLVSHNESTTQANDGKKKSWVCENEHALKKKGVGRGIHQSDVICSTMGWLKAASQSLEYGKNYEGYWNGELFVKQVR